LKRLAHIAFALVPASILTLALMVAVNPFSSTASASPSTQRSEALHGVHLMKVKDACHRHCGGGGNNLVYHGGTGGVGVETGPDKVYLVYWGSQWGTNGSHDPSGEAGIQQAFFNGVGGSTWNNSVTQYCEGVASGTIFCNGAGTAASNPSGVLAGVWFDSASAAPSSPSQSQLAGEAINAASHFGNTTASANTQAQYVINTATGNNASGFGTQYCAWHSSTSSSAGNIAYTNMPYITDAGASCGANFNGLGATAGITIVGGHEFAETETDIFPNGGWLDGTGGENGDKCAWITSGQQGAAANIGLSTGTFAVQSLWSNAFNSNVGGCVLSYP
jgi:serine protease